MPIKFRCTHCNQFLGISRAQGGSIVDCPSCGRTLRVPNLDGTVAPLPKPAIDLNDNSLASALEQLAALDLGVPEEPPAAGPGSIATAVAQAPPVKAVPLAPVSASPTDVPESEPPGATSSRPWVEVDEELASLAREAPEPAIARRSSVVTRRDLLVGATTTALVVPLTWWFATPRRAVDLVEEGGANRPAGRESAPAEPTPVAESVPALTGRITYITPDGESLPDAGARVLMFPEQRQGSALMSVDGFAANADAADQQLARESIKLSGGAYVLADARGRYGADLRSSGTYEILIISNYQSRPAGPVPADLLKSLARYFDRPQQLIGQRSYEFFHLRFTGREPAVRDHVFQRS
ncbi:hypothetical protein Pan44_30300 [Caulifigura coniformis]|uniref:Uncharacterized protein n=1 Tax=Caulifigura coniformis TaxID=2527983 RepID=A0A517SFU4_9PLAN|nr:hypothetical protein [Caulifigura coniformis]QDT54989.1 hypothetical protein Pan44_30300 [Caulifigura coniformis]